MIELVTGPDPQDPHQVHLAEGAAGSTARVTLEVTEAEC